MAIRLGLYAGSCAPPANATTAWATDSRADWVALAIARRLGMTDDATPGYLEVTA